MEPRKLDLPALPPLGARGSGARSGICMSARKHLGCHALWCECTCHDRNRSLKNLSEPSKIEELGLVGPPPAYLKYFHNIVSGGYSDSIVNGTHFTLLLTFLDIQKF